MPLPRSTAALLATLLLLGAPLPRVQAAPADHYEQGLRLRAALDSTPRPSRTRGQYDQALNAFRAVYHADGADPNADSSVEAVAELLAEEGRLFRDATLLSSAVEQLEFLRRDFPASRYSSPALLTEGEIEARDLHDADAADRCFQQFLASYPRSPLAPQARAELLRLGGAAPVPAQSRAGTAVGSTGTPAGSQRHVDESDYWPVGSQPAQPAAASTARPPVTRSQPLSASGPAPATQPLAGSQRPPQAGALQEQDVPASGGASAHFPADAASQQRGPASQPPGPTRVLGGVPVYRGVSGRLALVTGMRHWSTANYTRVAVDLQDEVPFEASRVTNPDRIFFDLHGAKLAPQLAGQAVTVTDGGFLERIRAAQFSGDVVRVVLDVSNVSDYSAFWLPNPSRLIIDIHGRDVLGGQDRPGHAPAPIAVAAAQPGPAPASHAGQPPAASAPTPAAQVVPQPHTPASRAAADGAPTPRSARAAAPGTFVAETTPPGSNAPASAAPRAGDSVAAIAALSQQPSRVRATRAPTTAPVSAVSAPAAASNAAPAAPGPGDTETAAADTASASSSKRRGKRAVAPTATVTDTPPAEIAASTPGVAAHPADPDATGGRSMVRALGLKINRIVVDAGHGGHDSGTLGPGGIQEKDVVLDVALRLGKLLKQRLGADVIYTRDDDTFIPLETRTAIANKAQADLFISVHANSSPDSNARGVETYYLNFTTSADALEVAARENAVSDESIHQLSDLVKKITLQDKIAESREFAMDVEGDLYQGLETGNAGLKDRGVKKAPFVVLIGANMPSILAEISFLTNPDDAAELRDGAYRQRIAESLYRGVARYERSLSGARLEQSSASR